MVQQYSLFRTVLSQEQQDYAIKNYTGYGEHLKNRAFLSSPEKVFLFFSIGFGILFLFITPPFQVPDEPNHFYRAYQMSEGHFIAEKRFPPALDAEQQAARDNTAREIRDMFAKGDPETALQKFYDLKAQGGIGGLLPESLATTANAFLHLVNPGEKQDFRDIYRLLMLPLNREKKVFIHFPNTALYSPIPYLPQACGIGFGKILNASPLMLMYLGRIANLSVWIFLVYLAIKVTPICKWLFLLLALMPMSFFQAASLSADSFTYGIAFLLIAVFLSKALDQTDGSRINISVLFVLSLLLSLSKQAYFLMPLLFLLIPFNRIGTKGRYYAIFFLIFLLDISSIFFWTFAANVYKDFYTLYRSVIPTWSAEKQVLFILSQPLEYCKIVIMTFIQNWRVYVDSFVGRLGQFDTPLPELFRISYIFMLFFAVLSGRRESIIISLRQRAVIFGTMLLSILVVSTLAFIGWAPVGSKSINMHGRYFIPLSPLFFLLIYNRKVSLNPDSSSAHTAISSYSLFSLTYTAYVIIKRYYTG